MPDFSSFANGLIGTVCSSDELLAAQLHLSPWQFALAKTALYVLLITPVLLGWWRSWPRLRANGFSKHVWRIGLWLLAGFTIIQVAKVLSQPLIGSPVPCPYDLLASSFIVVMALYALYFFHLGRGNKGSFSKFLLLIVGPLFGEVALNSREAGETGVRALIGFLEFAAQLLAHAHALIRI